MIKLVKATFHEYLEDKVADVFEKEIYDKETHRKKGETMSLYLQRKEVAWQKLKKARIELPKELLGYMTLRDANLSDRAWDAFSIWTKNQIDYETIVENLRKLDRPAMGKPGQTTTLFTDDDDCSHAVFAAHQEDEEEEEEDEVADAIPMPCSLYIIPENFCYDDDLTNASMNDDTLDNDDVVMVSGDIPEDHVFEEDDAVAICANWSQVRQFLHEEKLNRGYVKQKSLSTSSKTKTRTSTKGSKGSGKGGKGRKGKPRKNRFHKQRNTARPKKWSKRRIMSKSKCARCGKVGHWARDCTNEPDARGRANIAAGKDKPKTTNAFVFQNQYPSQGSDSGPPAIRDGLDVGFRAPNWVTLCFPNEAAEEFIELNVEPGTALIDPGAQIPLIGFEQLEALGAHLQKKYGKTYRWIHKNVSETGGIGGKAKIIGEVEIPI